VQIFAQDRASSQKPLKIVQSREGGHYLYIYDQRYELYETATGDRILSGAGRDPNFSPTGRFLAVRRTVDGDFDIFDIAASPVAVSAGNTDDKDRGPTDQGILVWGNNDSFLAIGGVQWGSLTVFNPLVGRLVEQQSMIVSDVSCHACRGWETRRIILDLDYGFIATFPTDDGSLESANAFVSNLFHREFVEVKAPVLEAYIRQQFRPTFLLPSTSNLGGASLQASHLYDGDAPISYAELMKTPKSAWPDVTRRQKEYVERLQLVFDHAVIQAPPLQTATPATEARSASQVIGTFRSGHPKAIREASAVNSNSATTRLANVFERLSGLGVSVSSPLPVQQIFKRKDVDFVQTSESKREMRSVVAQFRGARRNEDPFGEDGCNEEDVFSNTKSVFKWKEKDVEYFLVNTQCVQGTAVIVSSSAHLIKKKGKSMEMYSVHGLGGVGATWSDGADDIKLVRLSESIVALVSPVNEKAVLWNLGDPNGKRIDVALKDATLFEVLGFIKGGLAVLQLNRDGAFFITNLSEKAITLRGSYIDDEVVLYNSIGEYDSSFEGAQLLNVRFAGLNQSFKFDQFASRLYRPGLARSTLASKATTPVASFAIPPSVTAILDPKRPQDKANTLQVKVSAFSPVKEVRIFYDGRRIDAGATRPANGAFWFDLTDIDAGHWLTAMAIDADGMVSLPSSLQIPGSFRRFKSLNAVLVGIDRYADASIASLSQARYDVEHLASSLRDLRGMRYEDVATTELTNGKATREAVIAELRAAAKRTGEADRLLIHVAAHGFSGNEFGYGDGRFYVATYDTVLKRATETALSWSDIADAIRESRGTVIVLLDTCHSGLASGKLAASVDEAVSSLMTNFGAPIVILAASKGRQLSEESRTKGGAFTNALVSAIGAGLKDNNSLNLSDFYSTVKADVVANTDGRQTPWLARNRLIGEMPLF